MYYLYNCNISKPLHLSFLIKIVVRIVSYAMSYFQEKTVLPKNYICRFLLQAKLILIIFHLVLIFRQLQERRLFFYFCYLMHRKITTLTLIFIQHANFIPLAAWFHQSSHHPNLSRIKDCQILVVQVTSGYIRPFKISS